MNNRVLGTILLLLFPSVFFASACAKEDVNIEIRSPEIAVQVKKKRSWEDISKDAKDCVVQIFAYVNEPNILEPYKSPNRTVGAGSGFFIDSDGYLLTNYHVVSNSVALYIQIPCLGKERFEVEYVGGSPQKDIALLKLKDKDLANVKEKMNVTLLPFLSLGDSDSLVEAQYIMTLGYPLGQENLKVSIGSVSGRESTPIGECVQTTTPINPGNSGGPFVNDQGDVVGICVLKFAAVDVESVGYLIPINVVKTLLHALHTTTIVKNPKLGINAIPTLPSTLKYLGNPTDGGVFVTKVKKGLLGEQHGVQEGDIIYALDGNQIDRYGYLNLPDRKDKINVADYFARIELGCEVAVTLYRKGVKHDLVIKLESSDEKFKIKRCYPWFDEKMDYEVLFGAVFTPLTLNHIEIFKGASLVPEDVFDASNITRYSDDDKRFESKVIISSVLPTSLLHKSRVFMNGDIVLKNINGVEISTLEDVRNAIVAGKDDTYLTITTEGGSFVALPLEDLLRDELLLAERYGYTISSLFDSLLSSSDEENTELRFLANMDA